MHGGAGRRELVGPDSRALELVERLVASIRPWQRQQRRVVRHGMHPCLPAAVYSTVAHTPSKWHLSGIFPEYIYIYSGVG